MAVSEQSGARSRRTWLAALVAVSVAAGTTATLGVVRATANSIPDLPVVTSASAFRPWNDGLHRMRVYATPTSGLRVGLPRGASVAASSTDARQPEQLDATALATARRLLGPDGHLTLSSAGALVYQAGGSEYPVGAGRTDRTVQPATTGTPTLTPNSDWLGDTANGPISSNPTPAEQLTPRTQAWRPTARQTATAAWLRTQDWVATAVPEPGGGVYISTPLTPAQVAARPGVSRVDVPTAMGTVDAAVPAPNDPLWFLSWAWENSGAPVGPAGYARGAVPGADVKTRNAWSGTRGAGVVIAVVDSGLAQHNDLTGVVWTNPNEPCNATQDLDGDGYVGDCHGWNFVRGTGDTTHAADDSFHGTVVAGTIAARANNGIGTTGILPQASVMPLTVGSGSNVDSTYANLAIRYAVDHNADAINLSFGGRGRDWTIDALEDAIRYATDRGVPVVASAGNDSGNRDQLPSYPASFPNPGLIAVGNSAPDDTRDSSSGYGATAVDVFAPGTLLLAPYMGNSTGWWSGTSFSAPMVAAVAGALHQQNPNAGVAAIKQAILDGSDDVPALRGLCVSGARLNAGRILGGLNEAWSYRYAGTRSLTDAVPGHVTVTGVGPDSTGPYRMRMRLVTRVDGATWAVSDVPLIVGDQTVRTDDDGLVDIPTSGTPATGLTAAVEVELPAGSYALLAQAVDATGTVGSPVVAALTVATPGSSGQSGEPPTTPGSEPGQQPTPPGPIPTQPGPTATQPGNPTAPGQSAQPSPVPTNSYVPTGQPTLPGTAPTPGATPPTALPSTPGTRPSIPGAPQPSIPAVPQPSLPSLPAPTGPSTPPTASAPGSHPSSVPSSAPSSVPTNAAVPSVVTPTPSSSPLPPAPPTRLPGTDPYGITAITPTWVSTHGGDRVTLTGRTLPANPTVLVDGAPATITAGASASTLTFLAPPHIAGLADVTIYPGIGSGYATLTGVLRYVTPPPVGGGQPGQPTPGPGSTTVPSNPGQTYPPSNPVSPPAPLPSGGANQPSAAPTQAGPPTSPGNPGTDPGSGPTEPRTRTGPGGLRLVAAASLDDLDPNLWSDAAACRLDSCDATITTHL